MKRLELLNPAAHTPKVCSFTISTHSLYLRLELPNPTAIVPKTILATISTRSLYTLI